MIGWRVRMVVIGLLGVSLAGAGLAQGAGGGSAGPGLGKPVVVAAAGKKPPKPKPGKKPPILGAPDLNEGTLWQEIATNVFSLPPGENRFILSGWACPGSGAATLGFLRADESGGQTLYDGVEVSSLGIVIPYGSPAGMGISESVVVSQPNVGELPWYRLFVAFDYTHAPSLASRAFIVLENTSPETASHAVWFDGIQLERAIFPGQTRPTAYAPKKKLVSPSQEVDRQGSHYYFEW